jgi:peptide/nickel transport system substrate-binding protein
VVGARPPRRLVRLAAACGCLILSAASCGGDREPAVRRHGGTFKIAASGDVSSIDPGQVTGSLGLMLFRVMVRTLVTYPGLPGEAGNRMVADVATAVSDVSADGLTYRYTIKPGVKYQPEVAGGRQVTSADFRYAIERGFKTSVGNDYAARVFAPIVEGAGEFAEAVARNARYQGHIEGINVGDPRTVVFRLVRPVGDFPYRLALPLAAPVPEEYARPFDSEALSTYGENFGATGPYRLDRSDRTVTGYVPGKKIVLVRNPGWAPSTDAVRKAYPDRIEVTTGFEDPVLAANRILSGEFDYNGDFNIPPELQRSILAERSQKRRLFVNSNPCLRFVSLNTSIKPFDDVRVRRAVAYALDKEAMRATRGGRLGGDLATHVLVPGMTGFTEAGGRTWNPYETTDSVGDAGKARALMTEAGYRGGVYAGPPVLMVGSNAASARAVSGIVEASLAKIGIKVDRREFSPAIANSRYLRVPDARVAVGSTATWCWEYPDPVTVIPPLFDGRRITPSGNTNHAQIDDPTLNALIDKASAATGRERARLWAEADARIMDLVPVVPWLWDSATSLVSRRVVGFQFSLATSTIDLAVVALAPES